LVIERDLLISLLKLTKNEVVYVKDVNLEAKLPSAATLKLLHKLQSENLVYLEGDKIEADSSCRLRQAVKAVELGADIERVSNFLGWQEFEEFAALSLERNGYAVKKNVHFKSATRRWEIDVVGCRKPLVICIDCKHWHQGMHFSALSKIVASQIERVHAFEATLPAVSLDFECSRWKHAKIVPVVLSLVVSRFKFVDNVPVVPVLQFQDFLSQLPTNVDSLKFFSREFMHL
jgi:Holliday junction resolvase-like predicted endonuclease